MNTEYSLELFVINKKHTEHDHAVCDAIEIQGQLNHNGCNLILESYTDAKDFNIIKFHLIDREDKLIVDFIIAHIERRVGARFHGVQYEKE